MQQDSVMIGEQQPHPVNGYDEVIEDAPRTLEKIEGWKAIELTGPQREAFASAVAEVRDATVKVEPRQLLAPRRAEDRKPDLWSTANVVQENLMKGGIRGVSGTTGRRIRTRGVSSVAEDVRLNRALWTLTERMAELARARRIERLAGGGAPEA